MAEGSLAGYAAALPRGVGLGLRPELWRPIIEHAERIDFVELIVDDWLHVSPREARRLLAPVLERLPAVAHGVRLSIASLELDRAYVDSVARLLDALRIEVYTEHLSFRRAAGVEVEQFVPVPFSASEAGRVAANVREVQRALGRRVGLENVAYTLGHASAGLGEAGFLRAVAEEADCALLLDVTNLAINAANHGYDPLAFLDALPAERVLSAHAAGGHEQGHFHVDSHGHPLRPPTLRLLAEASRRSPLATALLERDKGYPPMLELLAELDALRAALAGDAEGPAELPSLGAPSSEAPADWGEAGPLLDRLAETLVRPGAWASLRETGPRDQADRWLLSFPAESVRAFSRVLRTKRREKIEPHLVGFFAVAEDVGALLTSYFTAQPGQSASRVDDVLGFARWLQDQPIPQPLRDLALHEAAVFELSTHPWHLWRRARRALELHSDPEELDRVHETGELPEAGELLRVRYERRRKGVYCWAEPA